MLRVAALFTLYEKLWMVCACLNLWVKLRQLSYGETLFWVELQIGLNPSLNILKYISETAPISLKKMFKGGI